MTNPPTPTPTLSDDSIIMFNIGILATEHQPDDHKMEISFGDLRKIAATITSLQSRLDFKDTTSARLQALLEGETALKASAASAELARDQAVAGMAVLAEAAYRHEGTGPNGEEPDRLICRLCHAGFFTEGETPVHGTHCPLHDLPAATSAHIKMVDELRAERDGLLGQVEALTVKPITIFTGEP